MDTDRTKNISADEINAHFSANDRFGMVSYIDRIGFKKFITRLEHEHYDPNNEELNDRYNIFFVPYKELMFVIVSIPLEDRHLAEKIAAECDICFIDGVPVVLGGNDGELFFPIKHNNLWSCGNLRNSEVYTSKRKELEAEEELWLNNFWAKKQSEEN
jgi:hypothetical protein